METPSSPWCREEGFEDGLMLRTQKRGCPGPQWGNVCVCGLMMPWRVGVRPDPELPAALFLLPWDLTSEVMDTLSSYTFG